MPYRSAQDPKIAHLQQLIATESDVRARLAKARTDHDALEPLADQLGREVAAAQSGREAHDRGGPLGAIAGWLGRSSVPEDAARLQQQLAEVEAKLAELVAAERDCSVQLDQIADAHARLAKVVAGRIATLASSDGAIGESLRALEDSRRLATEKLGGLTRVLRDGDHAQLVLADLLSISHAQGASPALSAVSSMMTEGILEWASRPSDREVLRARLDSHVPLAREMLLAFVGGLDELTVQFGLWTDVRAHQVQRGQLAQAADTAHVSPPTEAFAHYVSSTAACLDEVMSRLATERAATERGLEELTAQQRAIAEDRL
jgi:hypothetical protein